MTEGNFDVPESLRHFIRREIELGRFSSAEEVIEAGLLLLEERESRLAALRRLLAQSEHPGAAVERTGTPKTQHDRPDR